MVTRSINLDAPSVDTSTLGDRRSELRIGCAANIGLQGFIGLLLITVIAEATCEKCRVLFEMSFLGASKVAAYHVNING